MVTSPPYFIIVNIFLHFRKLCIAVMWRGEYTSVPGNYSKVLGVSPAARAVVLAPQLHDAFFLTLAATERIRTTCRHIFYIRSRTMRMMQKYMTP